MRRLISVLDMATGFTQAATDTLGSAVRRRVEDFLERHELIELGLTALRIEIGRVRNLL